MMRRCQSVVVLVAILAAGVLVSSACAAQGAWTPQKIREFSVERFGPDYSIGAPSDKLGFAWVNEEFKPESRIDAIRPAVEKAYRDSRDKEHYVRLMRANALDRPEDPVAVAKWAIVRQMHSLSRLTQGYTNLSYDMHMEKATLGWLLATAKLPGDAGYLRLRYMSESSLFVGDGAVPMGRKLIKRYPEDNSLLSSFAKNLCLSKDPKVSDEALAAALLLHEREKGSLRSCLTVRSVYTGRSVALGNRREDALKEQEWSRRSVAKAPLGSELDLAEKAYLERIDSVAAK